MSMVPQGWSVESADFINRLLQRKPVNRLGLRGPTEVKEHLWFKNYDWKNLYLGKLKAPFLPKKGDNFDFHYCNAPEKIGLETDFKESIGDFFENIYDKNNSDLDIDIAKVRKNMCIKIYKVVKKIKPEVDRDFEEL